MSWIRPPRIFGCKQIVTRLFFCALLLISGATYLPGYSDPNGFIWDENFHIPSAERYLSGVFFMEPHPPLGKLIISAGEWLLDANPNDYSVGNLEAATEPPASFSFRGYRLLPTLCAALVGPIIFLILLAHTRKLLLSAVIGVLPALDNALIVHSRAAMLEPPLLLTVLVGLLAYTHAVKAIKPSLLSVASVGVATGVALSIKINGAVLLIPLAHLLVRSHRSAPAWGLLLSCPTLVMLGVWCLHFALLPKVDTRLPQGGLFGVSPDFAKTVLSGNAGALAALLPGVSEALTFSTRYQQGVPTLDYCKEDENGSSPLLWPLGGRAINYRWESDGESTRYLYLAPNPVGWFLGLCGVVCAICTTISSLFAAGRSRHNHNQVALLLLAYLVSWLAPLLIPRVFYLYHYFIPLTISWLLLGLHIAAFEFKQIYYLIVSATVAAFLFMSPLTYYRPLTSAQLSARALVPIWDIHHQNETSVYLHGCATQNAAVRRSLSKWRLLIGGLQANYIEQAVGNPQQLSDGVKVQTNSRVQVPISDRYALFTGEVSVEPGKGTADILAVIKVDGRQAWSVLVPALSREAQPFAVSLRGGQVLTIETKSTDAEHVSTPVLWRQLSLTALK